MSVTGLQLKWTVSRARDTYGYNVVTLTDTSTGKRFRCSGGGYDMQGTVFGEWLQTEYQNALQVISERAHGRYVMDHDADRYSRTQNEASDALYGMTVTTYSTPGLLSVRIDGGCGYESVVKIARAIGLDITTLRKPKGGDIETIIVTNNGNVA